MTSFQKIILLLSSLLFILNGCSILPRSTQTDKSAQKVPPAPIIQTTKGGGYYQNDGPADILPEHLDKIPDAKPRPEPLHKYANNPYSVMGKSYTPSQAVQIFTQHGHASWYGRQFHGRKTASGEVYDMFAMTAAHPTLPIPSYVRVTNKANKRGVIVRINDRGPFHQGRIIDLSYSAAHRLDFIGQGSTAVIIEQIVFSPDGAPMNGGKTTTVQQNPVLSPVVSVGLDEPGIFVQIGAYRVRENADIMKINLMDQFPEQARLAQIIMKEDLFRVWVGPFASRHEAAKLSDQIYNRYGFKAVIVNQ